MKAIKLIRSVDKNSLYRDVSDALMNTKDAFDDACRSLENAIYYLRYAIENPQTSDDDYDKEYAYEKKMRSH